MPVVVKCPCCGASIRPIVKQTPSGGTVYYCPCCGYELD